MVNKFQKKVLITALYAGELMMKNGAEVYRVENTIEYMCRACKIDYVECFATTTGITLSLDSGNIDEDVHTFIKRIKNHDINLSKISRLNSFSREFTTTDLSVDDGFEVLKEIDAEPRYPFGLRILGAMLVGLALSPIFGGVLADSICSGIIAGTIYSISTLVDRLEFPLFFRTFVGCAFSALLSTILFSAGLCTTLAPVITASMSIYLPGVAITNAARDLISGDMLSGMSRFTEAILLAVGIAGGVGIVLKFYSFWGTITLETSRPNYPEWILTLCALFTVLGFTILSQSPKASIVFACIIGALGHLTSLYLVSIDSSLAAASFAGACVIATLAEICARTIRDATTIFIIPGIIPLVPGALLYQTMMKLLDGDITAAGSIAGSALMIALCIAAALVIISTLTRMIVKIVENIRQSSKKRAEAKPLKKNKK